MIVTVQSTSALLAALKTAQAGDTILLASGTYSAVKLSGLNFNGAVTIQSADPAHQAVIKDLVVANSSGLIFNQLDFTTATGTAASVGSGSSNITFADSNFYGPGAVGNAMMIRDSGNVTVVNSDFGNFGSGINELSSHHINITGNVFHDIQIEAIRGTGVTYQTISGNAFTDSTGSVANPRDAIYLWQDNVANHVVVESNNVFGASPPATVPNTSPPEVITPVTPPSNVVTEPAPSTPTPSDPATVTPPASTGATVTVSNTADLLKALKGAHAGDVIKLQAGTYDAAAINNLHFDGKVTITSAGPTEAVIKGLTVTNSSGLSFERLEVAITGNANAVSVTNSAHVSFSEMTVHGAEGVNQGVGFFVRNSNDVSIVKSEVTQLGSGIGHLQSSELNFSNNVLRNLGTDGIYGGASSHVVVSGNVISDFHPAVGAHPDAIQFFGYGGVPSSDIVISDNVITRGGGDPMQGIFIENTADLQITGNAIAGTMYNGISLAGASNAIISDNYVAGFSDMGSRIITRGPSSDVTIAHNSAQQIINYAGDGVNPNYIQVDNATIGGSAVGDLSAMNAWLAQRASLTASLSGGQGGDVLTGTLGADSMTGGVGNDTYLVNHAGDVVTEGLYGGVDTVKSTVSTYTLGANVEKLVLTGTAAQSGVGNGLNNVLTGNGVQSTLNGGGGADTLIATGGVNTFTGGAGADVFSFSKAPASPTVITDFTAGQDKIDLHNLLADYHGTNPLADKWVQVQNDSSGVTLLVDMDGPTGAAGFTAVAKLSGVNSLSASDWIFQ